LLKFTSVQCEQSEKSDCGVCKGEVKEGGKGVECDCCHLWFHSKCVSMDQRLYNALTTFTAADNGPGLYWYCSSCNKGFLEWKSELASVRMKQQELDENMKKMEEGMEKWKKENGREVVLKEVAEREMKLGVEELQQVVEKLEVESGENKKKIQDSREEVERKWREEIKKKEEDMKRSWVAVVKEDSEIKQSFVEIVKEQEEQWNLKASRKDREENRKNEINMRKDIRMGVVEEMEREKRRNNLVLMGVPEEGENGEGREIVKDVISGLMPGVQVNFELVGRIGKKGVGTRPVRIKVDDQSHRRKLLARAKDLKDKEGLDKIYIVPDLTRVQQMEDKKLREEVRRLRAAGERGVKIEKEAVVIRNGGQVVTASEPQVADVQVNSVHVVRLCD
jgi:hypothetical protein